MQSTEESNATHADDDRPQFPLRMLFVVTVALALLLAFIRWLGRWQGVQIAIITWLVVSGPWLLVWAVYNWRRQPRLWRRLKKIRQQRSAWRDLIDQARKK